MLKKIITLVGASALAVASMNAAVAGEETGLNIFGGATHFILGDNGSNPDIDNATGGILGLGYKFSKRWGIEGSYFDLGETDFESAMGSGDLDISGYRADLMYYFDGAPDLAPYLAIGGGEYDVDAKLLGASTSDDQSFFNIGAGVKKYFTDNLALRGDVRAIHNTSESRTDWALMLGLDYFFGSRAKAAPAPVRAPLDTDGDGVYDDADQCPNTPLGAPVDSVGCPLDSDGDGVFDYLDQCPNSPAGARVDEKGCQYVIKETVSVELEVLFDTNKHDVKAAYFEEIKNVAEFMKLFPATSVTIEGHTDSRGDAGYNQKLSQSRADAVRQVLISEHGIDASRVKAMGYGEDQPRADNKTTEGLQQNRRVIAVIKTEVEKTAK